MNTTKSAIPATKSNNNNNKVPCPYQGCTKKVYQNMTHCKCGRHYLGGECWWCNPKKAPNDWQYKTEAISKKAGQKSTTAILHQDSGLATPSTKATTLGGLTIGDNFLATD